MTMFARCRAMLPLAALAGLIGCQSMYYRGMESIGWHKRDLLVSRVEAARDEQVEAKEQFRTALEEFTALIGFEGGELQATYERLRDEQEACEDRAGDVRRRIESVESVGGALFQEWQRELDQYTSDDLRRRSEASLRDTRRRYDQLVGVMNRAAGKMDPVLMAFRDQVLFLKHNLNAQAVASLQGEVVSLESEIAELIAEMESAIAEADAFIEAMGQA